MGSNPILITVRQGFEEPLQGIYQLVDYLLWE